MRELFEDIWEQLPERLDPPDWAARRELLLSHTPAGARVLDLGCGEGRFTAELVAAGADVTGADVAEGALRRARAACPGGRFHLVPYGGPLPFGDEAFEVVWASEVLERVADTARFLGEARRVLRPGGVLLLTTPSAGRWRAALEGLPHPASDRMHLYTRASLAEVLRHAEFTQVEIKRLGSLRRRLGAVARF